MVAAGDCYLNEVMRVAGGANVFAAAAAPYPKVSLEEILARDPEVLIDMGEMAETAGFTEERRRSVAALWSRYPALKAVSGRRVFAVSSDIYVVPGPRVVEAAREFARMLHPGEFR
jgi:ABC-type Fe3+-hydroxamate transport system substrate-binding protein